MSGRTYAVTFSAAAIAAANDLFEISPASNKPVEIVGIELGQSTDAGDAKDAMVQISIIRGHTTSGSGPIVTVAIAPLNPDDTAAGFTAEATNATPATLGTTTVLHTGCWNVRAGYINWFPEGCRPSANSGNTTLVVRQTLPVESITMSGTLYVREL